MEENEEFGFEDFEGALFADDYQTDDDTDTEDTETNQTEETEQKTEDCGEDEPDGDENDEDEHTSESEENGADGNEKPDSDTNAGQTFTLKVNKEERTVTLDEMTALAQKGADYDRVKEQNAQKQQTIDSLQAQIDAQKGTMDILGIIAEKSGTSLEQLAQTLYVNFRKSAGASEDVAREELKSAKLEKELNSIKDQQAKQQEKESDEETRAKKDFEEFQRDYPDVELTEELVEKLIPDVHSGMSLSAAYRKYEKAQDAARIQELERKLAAKEQNAKNKRKSPGSQQDSGGRRTKSEFEDFEKALFD
jgi:hypothetical protein